MEASELEAAHVWHVQVNDCELSYIVTAATGEEACAAAGEAAGAFGVDDVAVARWLGRSVLVLEPVAKREAVTVEPRPALRIRAPAVDKVH